MNLYYTPIIKFFIIAISCLYIYHFVVFYLWKPVKKELFFWQVVIYFLVAVIGYYSLRRFFPAFYCSIFESVYGQRILNLLWNPFLRILFYFSLGGLIVSFITKKVLSLSWTQKKELKHGPLFTPTKIKKDKGITVGYFNQKTLPKHIQKFVKKTSSPIILPYNRLSRGITTIGDMGCGKSRLMAQIHNCVRDKYPNIPILIHDPKGEWLRTYYNPDTDLIFAPFDKRSCAWSLWTDFKKKPELKHTVISAAVESHHSGTTNDRFWSDSAITLLKDAASTDSLQEAKNFLITQKDLHADDRTFQSVFSTAVIGFRDIASVELIENEKKLTINDFLSFPGRIFLLNNPCCSAEQHGSLSLLLSAFLLEAISRPDVDENELRAVVLLDEALTFHLPADVEKAVYNQSRSKGLCIVSSAQRLPDKSLGERGEWSRQPANLFGMRVSDLETRTKLSQRLGQMIYEEKQKSESAGDKSTSETTSKIERKHAALAPEDFGKLKNREFILFHEDGIAPGRVVDVPGEQQNIPPIKYVERKEVVEFMRDF